jgi:hypothetical protein
MFFPSSVYSCRNRDKKGQKGSTGNSNQKVIIYINIKDSHSQLSVRSPRVLKKRPKVISFFSSDCMHPSRPFLFPSSLFFCSSVLCLCLCLSATQILIIEGESLGVSPFTFYLYVEVYVFVISL